MSKPGTAVLRVALPAPLMQLFDYLAPAEGPPPQPGQRVRVPFGRSRRVGIVVALAERSALPPERLRTALAILDEAPLIDAPLRALIDWSAGYYQCPPGEAYAAALPVALRQGSAPARPEPRWRVTGPGRAAGPEALGRRAPLQARLLAAAGSRDGLDAAGAAALGANWRVSVAALERRGWLARDDRETLLPTTSALAPVAGPELNPAQRDAIAAVRAAEGFAAFLLDGVTGSGKTEVYLALIEAALAAGRQSLVLVPEIGLTPQLLERFRARLGVPVTALHSGLAAGERLLNWCAAADGSARVLVGTRSAVFAPLPRPGLVVVDEEHDPSLKQQDGFRYSARDLAVWRARQLGVPVVLGSATPSFESLDNATAGRYRRLSLPERPGAARQPEVRLVDLRRHPAPEGLSGPLADAMRRHLDAGGQVLLYLNRRGFAPALVCGRCGHVEECRRCDARLVWHRDRGRLVCHHCSAERPAPDTCPDCGAPLRAVGQGTERLQGALQARFPDVPLVRIDRDSTRRRGELARLLGEVREGRARIIVGTQMLTKGHDFPDMSLVGIVDADQGLFGTDFRSSERLAQAFVQVAGRAGRAERPGEVFVQTAFPEHPLLRRLVDDGYRAFAEDALAERRAAGWPPFGCLALLRAESPRRADAERFLAEARAAAAPLAPAGVTLLGPAPAPMERRAGRYRFQLLAIAPARAPLQRFLKAWRGTLDGLASARRARWSLDVDPAELF